MDFGQAIVSGFQGYVRFSGRSSRFEYWYWVLFVLIATAIAAVIDAFLFSQSNVGVLGAVVSLGLFLPGLAVSVRRLHDIDKSGWWILLALIPIIGAIIIIIWACTKGTAGPNRFGGDSLAGAAAA